MQQKEKRTKICPFCGKEIQGVTITDDGYDFYGHHRGMGTSDTSWNKCRCEFGKLVNSMPQVKKMCRNCAYYRGGYCTNKKEIEEVKKTIEIFSISADKLSVKDPYGACSLHELNYSIFKELMKDD